MERAIHGRDLLIASFPDEIGHPEERGAEGTSFQRRLGKALGRKCGTRFGELELRIERAELETHTKVQRWCVAGKLSELLSGNPAGFHSNE